MRTGRGAARIHHSFFAARRFSHRYPVRMENAGSEELGPRCERFLYRGLLRPAPSVLVRPNTLVEFQGDAVEIGQGGVVIATSRRMIARAYGLTIRPGTQTQSKFEVAENGDSVFVAAQQGSVTLSDGKESSTVPEGQQTTKKKKGADAVPGATGGTFPAKTVAIVAGVEGAGALAGILIANSGGKKCISPTGDNKKCCTKDQQGNEKCQ